MTIFDICLLSNLQRQTDSFVICCSKHLSTSKRRQNGFAFPACHSISISKCVRWATNLKILITGLLQTALWCSALHETKLRIDIKPVLLDCSDVIQRVHQLNQVLISVVKILHRNGVWKPLYFGPTISFNNNSLIWLTRSLLLFLKSGVNFKESDYFS